MLFFALSLSARAACWASFASRSLLSADGFNERAERRVRAHGPIFYSRRVGVCAVYYEARVEFTSNTSALLAQAISRLTADKAGAETAQCKSSTLRLIKFTLFFSPWNGAH
jgi:hypothetical protein